MARGQSDLAGRPGEPPLLVAGRLALRAGIGLTVLALPLGVGAFLAVVLPAPSLAAGLDSAVAATSGPLGAPDGVGWLLHVGSLGFLAGLWLAGAGLVLSELLE